MWALFSIFIEILLLMDNFDTVYKQIIQEQTDNLVNIGIFPGAFKLLGIQFVVFGAEVAKGSACSGEQDGEDR